VKKICRALVTAIVPRAPTWRTSQELHALIKLRQAIIEEESILRREKVFPFLFDADADRFELPYFKIVAIHKRLREPPLFVENNLAIDADDRFAEELVEVEFDDVFLVKPCFDRESHADELAMDLP
jgi:hypothetical protein